MFNIYIQDNYSLMFLGMEFISRFRKVLVILYLLKIKRYRGLGQGKNFCGISIKAVIKVIRIEFLFQGEILEEKVKNSF